MQVLYIVYVNLRETESVIFCIVPSVDVSSVKNLSGERGMWKTFILATQLPLTVSLIS